MTLVAAPRVLILACGALAREIRDIARLHDLDNVTLECLPANLHMTPDLIAPAVRRRLRRHDGAFARVLLGYADCGTSGHLVDVCAEDNLGAFPGECDGTADYQYKVLNHRDYWDQLVPYAQIPGLDPASVGQTFGAWFGAQINAIIGGGTP